MKKQTQKSTHQAPQKTQNRVHDKAKKSKSLLQAKKASARASQVNAKDGRHKTDTIALAFTAIPGLLSRSISMDDFKIGMPPERLLNSLLPPQQVLSEHIQVLQSSCVTRVQKLLNQSMNDFCVQNPEASVTELTHLLVEIFTAAYAQQNPTTMLLADLVRNIRRCLQRKFQNQIEDQLEQRIAQIVLRTLLAWVFVPAIKKMINKIAERHFFKMVALQNRLLWQATRCNLMLDPMLFLLYEVLLANPTTYLHRKEHDMPYSPSLMTLNAPSLMQDGDNKMVPSSFDSDLMDTVLRKTMFLNYHGLCNFSSPRLRGLIEYAIQRALHFGHLNHTEVVNHTLLILTEILEGNVPRALSKKQHELQEWVLAFKRLSNAMGETAHIENPRMRQFFGDFLVSTISNAVSQIKTVSFKINLQPEAIAAHLKKHIDLFLECPTRQQNIGNLFRLILRAGQNDTLQAKMV